MSAVITPNVSIIIPTYNHSEFLYSALKSVCNQTYNSWEAIVINNFSDDNTIEVVESFKDPRIKIFNFSNNGIIALSRNFGIKISSAPLIAFLDSDDTWYPKKLAACLDKISCGYDLICHAEKWIGPGKRSRLAYYGPEERATYENLLLNGNILSTSAIVVRREWIERVGHFNTRPDFITAEDYELWLKLARDGARIGFINEVLGEYLIHQGNQSRAALNNMNAVMAVFRNHLTTSETCWTRDRVKRREALIYYSGARSLQDNGKYNDAWQYFFKAIFTYPFVVKFYYSMLLNFFHLKPR